MTTTTTTSGSLYAAPDAVSSLGTGALLEVARSATLAQNLAAATRFEVAHALVEDMRRDLQSQAEADRAAGRPVRPAYARLDPAARARDHLAATMSLTCWHAARLVTAGVQIHTRLPRLRSALAHGLLPEQLATDAACRLADVPDGILPGVESDVIAQLTGDVTGGDRPSRTALDAMIDTSIERHDPRADDAVADALEGRTVTFRPARDGMATLWAKLPVLDAENLRRRLETDVRAAVESGSRRTIDQLLADALSALATAPTTDAGGGTPGFTSNATGSAGGSAGEPIRITVIAAAARGLPNRVDFVYGAYTSFDWLCENLLAGDDARVRFEAIDPAPGTLDTPDGALKYVISPALAERIRLRDGTCRHPGCTEPAAGCDIDHVIAFDHLRPDLGGPTAEWNLMCLCRRHHREKTFGHNAYRPGPLGELIIITPSGDHYRSRPRGALAQARDQHLEAAWRRHTDHLIADDGLVANPPGTHRHSTA